MVLDLYGKRYALRIGFYDSGRRKLELEDGLSRLEITGENNLDAEKIREDE